MSGTSLDGVDGVLADLGGVTLAVLAHASAALPTPLKDELLALNQAGVNELHRAALAANALMQVYADVVKQLLEVTGTVAQNICAIGAHGQTVRHQPQSYGGTGYTVQLCNPALLAELTGIQVAADFRSRDIAAGGQGAPLVPVFHQAVFGQPNRSTAVLNLGGMANLTVIDAPANGGQVIGFDCGPGNVLLDAWCQQHQGRAFDAGGNWAGSGQVDPGLLANLLAEPYFALSAPKSTGRDLFNRQWLNKQLAKQPQLAPVDVQRTLTELTASACATCVTRYAKDSTELIVCGGGAFNQLLMQRLQALLPEVRVRSSAAHGLPPMQVEAAAFAWLARKTVRREALPLQAITGAKGARIAGAIYPA